MRMRMSVSTKMRMQMRMRISKYDILADADADADVFYVKRSHQEEHPPLPKKSLFQCQTMQTGEVTNKNKVGEPKYCQMSSNGVLIVDTSLFESM